MTIAAGRIVWSLVVLAAAVAAVPAAAMWQWRATSAGLTAQLSQRSRGAADALTVVPADALPAPVARYFQHVLPPGQPRIALADLTQEGDFNAGATPGGWRPFRATQRFRTDPPGFIWSASVRMGPFLPVVARDQYIDGRGSMLARVLAVYTVARDAGTPEIATAALQRYLAEAAWFPTALLPGRGVTWQAIDAHSAAATLTDGDTSARLEFEFDDAGDVTGFLTPARAYALGDGRYETYPWAGRFSAYATHQGIRIPMACEVEWRLPGGPLPYWRGQITGVRYEFER